jgi:hypothetical protein
MQSVALQYVLNDMERIRDDGKPHIFSIEFIRATGKYKGFRKKVNRVMKLQHGAGHNHKEAGTIPLYCLREKRPITPCIANLLFYNDLKIRH